MDMMRKSVEQRAGQSLGAEHRRPLVERQVAGDDRSLTQAHVCGRPRLCKKNLQLNLSTWSGADVCPASCCGFTDAAGPYGNTRIGSITFTRVRDAVRLPGFSDPVSLTVVHEVQETFSHNLRAPRTDSKCLSLSPLLHG